MKNIFILFLLTFSLLTNAQTKKTHIPASESIIGIWRQTTQAINTLNGQKTDILSGNYKIINADGTYYTFITWPNETVIGQYGSYIIKSDSMLIEHIIMHVTNPSLNGKDSPIKYNLIDKNTMMAAWTPNGTNWINEKWIRLPLTSKRN